MGVHSLWKILEPTSRPVRLESLNRKKMAIDASIWIYQFLKAMRDKSSGQGLKRSHVVGFFRRICKLLFFGIMPVFVFDGGAPVLKRETIRKRKERRTGKREGAEITARRLLAMQLQRKQQSLDSQPAQKKLEDDKTEYKYMEDLDKTQDQLDQEKRARFKSTDEYHLPQIKGFEHTKDDTRVAQSIEDQKDLKSIAEQVDELDGIDLNTIDPASSEFASLPLSTQYMVLSQLRLRSRLRMGYTKEQLEDIFPDSKDFSKFQIKMVQKRNYFTQRLMNVSGMDTNTLNVDERSDEIRRVAGERGRSYRIQKNEGGWSLSLDDSGTSAAKAIDLDKEEKKKTKTSFDDDEDDEDDDIEWEDVSLEPTEKKKINYSISALPLPPAASTLEGNGVGSAAAKAFSFSPNKNKTQKNDQLDFEDENDEDVLKQIEEIELIEAIQKSKADLKKQQELEQEMIYETIKDQQVSSQSDNTKQQKVKTDANVFGDLPFDLQELTPVKPSTNPISEKSLGIKASTPREINSIASSSASKKVSFELPKISNQVKNTKLRSEMDHILNLNPQILNFSRKKPTNVSQNETETDKTIESAVDKSTELPIRDHTDTNDEVSKENKQSADQPSWFNESFNNPYSKSNNSVTTDAKTHTAVSQKTKGRESNTNVPYNSTAQVNNDDQFLSFFEVQEMLKKKEEETQQQSNEGDESDVEEIVPNEQIDLTEVQDQDTTTVENFVEPSNIVEVDHEDNHDVALKESQESNKEPTTDADNEIIDYEFYESDEERLQEQLDKEEEEHQQFQKDLNPRIINTLSIDPSPVPETSKTESYLREQQNKELRDSDEVTQDMITDVQELLACFGIPYITAPMEAEAQCAELLKLGLVDGIVTDDSDVFLFAGDMVYKNMFHEKNYVEFYNGKGIEKELGLDQSKFIMLAHLLGSDYAEGLKGIGPVNAMEILGHFENLENFRNWFTEGQFDLVKQGEESSFEKKLRTKLVKNGIDLDSKFPDGRISQGYLNPEVDHDKTEFVWGSPDLDRLRSYLNSTVGWGQDKLDQVLIPLIKDLNQKKRTGVQSTLTEFYSVDEVSNYSGKKKVNKRMIEAKEKIKKRKRTK